MIRNLLLGLSCCLIFLLASSFEASFSQTALKNRQGGGGVAAFEACCHACPDVVENEILCVGCNSSEHEMCQGDHSLAANCSVAGDIVVCTKAKRARQNLTTKQPKQKSVVPTLHEGCCGSCDKAVCEQGDYCCDCTDVSHSDCKGGIASNCYLLNSQYKCTKDKPSDPGFTSNPPKKKPGLTTTPPAKR